jgi:hypothetical protein
VVRSLLSAGPAWDVWIFVIESGSARGDNTLLEAMANPFSVSEFRMTKAPGLNVTTVLTATCRTPKACSGDFPKLASSWSLDNHSEWEEHTAAAQSATSSLTVPGTDSHVPAMVCHLCPGTTHIRSCDRTMGGLELSGRLFVVTVRISLTQQLVRFC